MRLVHQDDGADEYESDDEEENDETSARTLHYAKDRAEIAKLLGEGIAAAKKRGDCSMHLALTAVSSYHNLISGESPKPRMQASYHVASILYSSEHRTTLGGAAKGAAKFEKPFKYRSEKIRSNFSYFCKHRCLPLDRRGNGVSNPSRIHDAGFAETCRGVIAALQLKSKEWSARDFRIALIAKLRADGTLSANQGVSTKAVCFYLRYLDMVLVEPKKGIYKDGHERPDVVLARKKYCNDLDELKSRMPTSVPACDNPKTCESCCGKGCIRLEEPADGPESRVIKIFHDECIMASNEGRCSYWGRPGDRLFRKSKGKCRMVSGFICECHGRMEVKEHDVEAFEKFAKQRSPDLVFKYSQILDASGKTVGYSSFTTITPGKNDDGWWTGENVVAQVAEVTVIFEFLHCRSGGRKTQGLFIFDNSTNHSCYPPGALHVSSGINKSAGGANAPGSVKNGKMVPRMRDGWYLNKQNERVVQSMHNADGLFKGTEAILLERGRAIAGIRATCILKDGDVKPNPTCCLKHMLAAEADFKEQASALEELIISMGHMAKMLPKCHPELNPIEQFWAAVKEYLRRVCGYSFAELKENIPAALASVPLEQVQRYFQRAWRFQELYLFEFRHELELPAAVRDHAMKKYKRHRTVPTTLLQDVETDLTLRHKKLLDMQKKGKGKLTVVKLEHVSSCLSALKPVVETFAAHTEPAPMQE